MTDLFGGDEMVTAVCIDDRNGMTLFGKRQSRDREIVRDFVRLCRKKGGRVLIAPFSSVLFTRYKVITDDNLLENAGKKDFCFIENKDILPYAEKIEKLVVYKWNRDYPSDVQFTMPEGFVLSQSVDFEGYSHEKITRLIYVKEGKG